MSLTEIMSSSGLSSYAEVALLLFFFAFLVIMWRIFRPSKKRELESHKTMPLDNESSANPPRSSRES
jgi:cbb3-type cytochrome oxidase subunit 3